VSKVLCIKVLNSIAIVLHYISKVFNNFFRWLKISKTIETMYVCARLARRSRRGIGNDGTAYL